MSCESNGDAVRGSVQKSAEMRVSGQGGHVAVTPGRQIVRGAGAGTYAIAAISGRCARYRIQSAGILSVVVSVLNRPSSSSKDWALSCSRLIVAAVTARSCAFAGDGGAASSASSRDRVAATSALALAIRSCSALARARQYGSSRFSRALAGCSEAAAFVVDATSSRGLAGVVPGAGEGVDGGATGGGAASTGGRSVSVYVRPFSCAARRAFSRRATSASDCARNECSPATRAPMMTAQQARARSMERCQPASGEGWRPTYRTSRQAAT